ncbi:hypothetical protein CKO42_16605 [Lamprobacter modestohalophilus]|uniref:Uncharacterized protein n=1 Tax=Lamprobacter modestohalophilus TaxID=1064514 RepID=A0A9X0WAW6_9GAMM|nr:hypothetical protein [Lamprobacter modestohalophilus]MBK1620032.1 hypothetical protein [Lamprobacter modestohalophilus]
MPLSGARRAAGADIALRARRIPLRCRLIQLLQVGDERCAPAGFAGSSAEVALAAILSGSPV